MARRWASLTETAIYLATSERHLRYLREKGRIKSYNPSGGHVLFDLDEVDAWVAEGADLRSEAATADDLAAEVKRQARNRRRNAGRSLQRPASPAPGGAARGEPLRSVS